MRPGDVYYSATADDDGKVSIDTWVLRTLRGKHGYLTLKIDGTTWMKSGFGARATWGWASSIPRWCRTKFRLEKGVPAEYARSTSQAVRIELRRLEQYGGPLYDDESEWLAKGIPALKRRLAHEMCKKAA